LANYDIAEIYDEMTMSCTGDILAEDVAQLPVFVSLASTIQFPEPEDQINDLTGLQCMPLLWRVDLSNNLAEFDLSPLSGAGALERLELSGNQIVALSPLAGLSQLEYLDLSYNSTVSDLSPLAGLTQLNEVDFTFNSISDISPLSELPALESVGLSQNAIADIGSFSISSSIKTLNLSWNELSNIDAVAEMSGLSSIDFRGNDVSVLSPLLDNEFFGVGCVAWFNDNPMDCVDQATTIEELTGKGVQLFCDCDSCS
jgi:internalin A